MARKTIFIHAGATKTGSSALQAWFARNIEELRRLGVHYPTPHRLQNALDGRVTTGNGGDLARLLKPDTAVPRPPKDMLFARLDAAISGDCDKILFSTETIQGGARHKFIELKRYFDVRRVDVVFISLSRNIADHAFSMWGQELKRSGITTEWAERVTVYRAPFLSQLSVIEEVFGRDKIISLNYDSIRDDLVRSFFDALRIPGVIANEVGTINRSLSSKELSYMLYINKLLMDRGINARPGRLSRQVSDYLLEKCSAQPLSLSISPAQYTILERNNKHVVEEFNRRFLPDDPIGIARPNQISEPIVLEPLSDEDKAIAAKLTDLLTRRPLDRQLPQELGLADRSRRLARV